MSDVVLQLLSVERALRPRSRRMHGVEPAGARRARSRRVLGSNGAGKTTILKTISGIIDPRSVGSMRVQGPRDRARQGPARIVQQGLSHVLEGREVFPLLSVRDNLLMGAYTRQDRDGVAQRHRRVFGYFPILRERATQDAGTLSGGQQQMLAISRAIMCGAAA
jgi:branched-chain amino acid transport system ATP-binding protein